MHSLAKRLTSYSRNPNSIGSSFLFGHNNGVRKLFEGNVGSAESCEFEYFNDKTVKDEENFQKILIANRGEIACRIIKTARKMGIKTVAVYSEVDYNSVHMTLADESVYIGPSVAKDSYLFVENILAAVKQTGAEAVHPGYGFLSENTKFVEALDSEGVQFIGPPASCIAGMGDKLQSKQLAIQAGVNTIPVALRKMKTLGVSKIETCIKSCGQQSTLNRGHRFIIKNPCITEEKEVILHHLGLGNKSHDLVKIFCDMKFVCNGGTPSRMERSAYFILQELNLKLSPGTQLQGYDGIIHDPEECVSISRKIGYPVMIKASAGGGGKGMRIAYNDNEAREGFRLSSQEAASSFGDDRMLVEKYIDNPRHIEIQVLCDKHGNAIHLNERECSIQRRNQKVIEEAPSTFLDNATRIAMGDQAVSLCKRIKYCSAGTVEFLVDEKQNFYFLEMNTRLQVEHPITECITGVDIVRQMIRIAKGHKLPYKQNDIPIKGWAIESRVYAEDPFKNFGTPSVGHLYKYIEPVNLSKVRCDSGVTEGSKITIYYDPMICKLVCYGDTRQEAISKSIQALDNYVIRGVCHNIPLLRDIMSEENFVRGAISTKYLQQVYPNGFVQKQLDQRAKSTVASFVAAIFAKYHRSNFYCQNSTKLPNSWKLNVTIEDEDELLCDITLTDTIFYNKVNNISVRISDANLMRDDVVNVETQNYTYALQLVSKKPNGLYQVCCSGTTYNVKVLTSEAAALLKLLPKKIHKETDKFIFAPMPGVIRSLNCVLEEEVSVGKEICVIEAMKMQNSIHASNNGKIKSISIEIGSAVNNDDVLVEFY